MHRLKRPLPKQSRSPPSPSSPLGTSRQTTTPPMLWPLPNTAKRVMTSPLLTIALTEDSHNALHLITTALQQTWKQNSVLRFAASGVCGNAVFYGLDKLILPLIVRASDGFIGSSSSSTTTLSFMSKRGAIAVSLVKWLRANAESVSFFVSYLLDIFVQRKLKSCDFGDSVHSSDDCLLISHYGTVVSSLPNRLSECIASIWDGYDQHEGVVS
jgi:hypothetical protein